MKTKEQLDRLVVRALASYKHRSNLKEHQYNLICEEIPDLVKEIKGLQLIIKNVEEVFLELDDYGLHHVGAFCRELINCYKQIQIEENIAELAS